ncbi:hypothetical protein NIES4103_43120 [Nostoc sp. NIES-4103]|nr:hypothetical protein NIES4103_43120 [Nostoc sp. NIES-4103]
MVINVDPTSRPMTYLFRSKLDRYIAKNAVGQSILLVDFDHGVSLIVLGVKTWDTQQLMSKRLGKFSALKAVR